MRIKGSLAADALLGLLACLYLGMYCVSAVKLYNAAENYEIKDRYSNEELPCEIWCNNQSLYGY